MSKALIVMDMREACVGKNRTGLFKYNLNTVEIVDIDGVGRVALTALGTIRNGFKVIVNTKAIGTMFEKAEITFSDIKEKGATFVG